MKADDIWLNRLDICKFYLDINKLPCTGFPQKKERVARLSWWAALKDRFRLRGSCKRVSSAPTQIHPRPERTAQAKTRRRQANTAYITCAVYPWHHNRLLNEHLE
jgi:hypothetical protein